MGTKRHLVVDRHGVPLAVTISGSNVHDSKRVEEAIDAVPPLRLPGKRRGRPRQRPVKVHADKGFDYSRCRRPLRRRGIIPRIARRGIESSERLGRYRWVVERTLSWLNRFRRLKVRYERRVDIHESRQEASADRVARLTRLLHHGPIGLRGAIIRGASARISAR